MDIALWVFGYGSLLWNPGFPHQRAELARLPGWHRSFCMTSIHYRGTPDAPGLVLALDHAPGAHCDGLAFAVEERHKDATLAYLRERELISEAYLEDWLEVDLASGQRVRALSYVINRDHAQYAGGMSLDAQAAIIAASIGDKGPNCDYLFATVDHLAQIGVSDNDMTWLCMRVRELRNQSSN